MKVVLTNYTKDPIACIEEAASTCYDSRPSHGEIVKKCYMSGHESVFEFADFTFFITDVSRALLAQLTRHRIASFAVRSQRYCDEKEFKYVLPPSIEKAGKKDLYDSFMLACNETYSTLLACGVPKEDARMILPNACYTSLEMKMNGRELMHFCNERLCNRAQWEIRELANEIVKELKAAAETYFDYGLAEFTKYLVPKCEVRGYNICPENKSCGKHRKFSDSKSLVEKPDLVDSASTSTLDKLLQQFVGLNKIDEQR